MDYPRKLVVPVMQLSDATQRLLDDAVAEFARETRFPLAFGGFEISGHTRITSLYGNRTLSLCQLEVAKGLGLGGRAMTETRPRLTVDYSRSPHITHDYDGEVMAERVKMLFALPVVVDGNVRAVLYGGNREGDVPGKAFVQAGTSIASELAKEIRIEDEVERRVARKSGLSDMTNRFSGSSPGLSAEVEERLRSSQAELRRIASLVDDPELRNDLLALEHSLVGTSVSSDGAGITEAAGPGGQPKLSPREIDVLAHVALGATNHQVALTLSLRESTVKSYLNSAMSKLGASTRYAAVTEARRAGIIR